MEEGRLVVTPVPAPRFSLDALLADLTPHKLHSESDWGTPAEGAHGAAAARSAEGRKAAPRSTGSSTARSVTGPRTSSS